MNMDYPEHEEIAVAKTCGCKRSGRKVTYILKEESHSLCLDRKDILTAQLLACEKLIKYATDPADKEAVTKEIVELRLALDLIQ
jgi:hypothetical protein